MKTEPLDDVEDHPTEDPLPKIVKLESEPDEGFSPPEKKQKTTSALKDLFGDVFITKVEPGESLFERVDSKINLYRTEPNIELDSDPLLLWKVNENKFPLLSKVAKKYLVESIFNRRRCCNFTKGMLVRGTCGHPHLFEDESTKV